MSKKNKLLSMAVSVVAALLLLTVYFRHHPVAVLAPQGSVARSERHLMFVTIGLMLIIVIPVFALTFGIVYKYRVGRDATYTPDWDGSRLLETLWWGFPIVIITILAMVTWRASHDLDPSKPLASNQRPLVVQVVALQYKWLFIYPEQQIATLNYFQFPAGRPVSFKITSDAPMNSFWIPQLGGQVYAMSGMSMPLQLEADRPGAFRGVSANISGRHFADMHFTAVATSSDDFATWAAGAKHTSQRLNAQSYTKLMQPSTNAPLITYASVTPGLYDAVVEKYLRPWDGASQQLGGSVRQANYVN